MGTRAAQIDSIYNGGQAVDTVGLPDNLTSPDVDCDGMLDRSTHWSVLVTVTWDRDDPNGKWSMVATNLQYADKKRATASYLINALNAEDGQREYEGADSVHVALLAPGYREVAAFDK